MTQCRMYGPLATHQLTHPLTSSEEWWRPRACEGLTLAFFLHSLLRNQFLFLCLPLILTKSCQWVFKVPIIINHLAYISNLGLCNCCDKIGGKLIIVMNENEGFYKMNNDLKTILLASELKNRRLTPKHES